MLCLGTLVGRCVVLDARAYALLKHARSILLSNSSGALYLQLLCTDHILKVGRPGEAANNGKHQPFWVERSNTRARLTCAPHSCLQMYTFCRNCIVKSARPTAPARFTSKHVLPTPANHVHFRTRSPGPKSAQ